MHEVVACEDPMVDPETLRAELPDATVTVADVDGVADLRAAARGADAVVVDVNTPVSAEVVAALDLTVVARAGVGVDNVAVAAAADHGTVVTNVPEYCTDEVATHTVALLLDCVRKVAEYDRDVRPGRWAWDAGRPIHRFPGSTLGLVSFGPIARRTTERLAGFDLDVVAYDPYVEADEMAEYGVEKAGFETLLDTADYVSLHAPLTDETAGMMDAEAFDRMRDRAVLVNTGRGGLIEEDALAAALDGGDIAAAGLDVLRAEPPEDSPLFDLDNCLLTPHAAWYSEEARDELNATVAANLRAALAGERPPNVVEPDTEWL